MIDLACLQHFVVVARSSSLADASLELHLTPSALSKSLKRLEESLQTSLFDRDGRALRLNAAGRHLEQRAAQILHEAGQLQSEFAGDRHSFKCRVVGPPLLQLAWGLPLSERLFKKYPQANMQFEAQDDRQSLASIVSGEHDIALLAVPDGGIHHPQLCLNVIGDTEYRVAFAPAHPLYKFATERGAQVEEVMQYDFVTPLTPAFSNMERMAATDGWRDDIYPRRHRYRTDDILLSNELVKSGKALAYLPDFIIRKLGLEVLLVKGCPYFCRQQIALVYRSTATHGWLSYLCEAPLS